MSPSVGLKSFTVSSPDPHIKMSFPLPPLNVSSPPSEIITSLPFPSLTTASPKLASFPFPLSKLSSFCDPIVISALSDPWNESA